ncbi:MAG TPA: TolC family protein [Polyangiaceae bacterium]|nr:TolC family protein [Polyangiaceae bacterium]
MTASSSKLLLENPMMARSLALATILLFFGAHAGAETISERDVERRVLSHPEVAAARQNVALATARQTTAGLYPNPSVAWQREDFPGYEREDVVSLTLPVDVSGRRGAARALGRAETASTRAGEARTRTALTVRALDVFYAAIAAEQRVKVVRAAVTRLEEATRVLAARQSAGNVSGYDTYRLQVALELARSDLDRVSSEQAALRAQLAFLVGMDERTLVLRATPASVAPPATARNQEPRSLRDARSAISEARKAGDAARSAWLPTLEVTAGFRVGAAEETRYGYVAGIAVELPLWSRGQDVSAEARAREGLAAAEASALEHAAASEQLTAQQELQGALIEQQRLRGVARERFEQVLRAAESSYREGTRPLSELLDAHDMARELELRSIDAELRGRRASVRLRAARGEFE